MGVATYKQVLLLLIYTYILAWYQLWRLTFIMKKQFITFEIIVDTRETPFSPDDIYEMVEKEAAKVNGWENALLSKELEIRPSLSFDPATVAILSLSVAVIGLTYQLAKDYFDQEARKIEVKMKLKNDKVQLKLLQDISTKLDTLVDLLEKYGEVNYRFEDSESHDTEKDT